VLCWILGFVREDANMAKKVRDAGVADLNAHADALPDFIVDWFDDVERPLARACGISGSTPNAEIAIELSRRAYLQAYSGDSEGDWPLQDDLVPEVRT